MPGKKITLRMPKELKEDLDGLVERGLYEDRTEAVSYAIDLMTENRNQRDDYLLLSAAVTAYLEADERDMYQIRDNARDHIRNEFEDSRVSELLED